MRKCYTHTVRTNVYVKWRGRKKAMKTGGQTLETTSGTHPAGEHAADSHEEFVDKQPNQGTSGISIAEVVAQDKIGSYGEKNEEKAWEKDEQQKKKIV